MHRLESSQFAKTQNTEFSPKVHRSSFNVSDDLLGFGDKEVSNERPSENSRTTRLPVMSRMFGPMISFDFMFGQSERDTISEDGSVKTRENPILNPSDPRRSSLM